MHATTTVISIKRSALRDQMTSAACRVVSRCDAGVHRPASSLSPPLARRGSRYMCTQKNI